MAESIHMFKKIIMEPSNLIDNLKDKSFHFLLILIPLNIALFGLTYMTGHFFVNIFHPTYWILSLMVGMLGPSLGLGALLGIYFITAKILKESEIKQSIKVIAYLYLIAYTIYHAIALPVITALVSSHNSYLAVYFYDISHLILNIWLISLFVQGIQIIRSESEIRSLLKVSSSVFGEFCVASLLYLWIASILVNFIVR